MIQQRQQRVRGGAGDDLQQTSVLTLAECLHQIASAVSVGLARRNEPAMVKLRHRMHRLVQMRPVQLLAGEFDEAVQMPCVTPLEQRIEQHGAERGRERQCEPRR